MSALREQGLKTTGDDDYTVWQVLVSELDGIVNLEYLQKAKLREKVPIAYCTNVNDITNVASFVPAILVRVTQTKWELMDENDDEMEQLEWDGDEGIANMVGMYIRHPDREFCEYFKSMTRVATDDDKMEMTPKRKELRKRAHGKMVKASESMKKRALAKNGDNKVCEVGEVVLVPLNDMDRAKVASDKPGRYLAGSMNTVVWLHRISVHISVFSVHFPFSQKRFKLEKLHLI